MASYQQIETELLSLKAKVEFILQSIPVVNQVEEDGEVKQTQITLGDLYKAVTALGGELALVKEDK